MGYGGDDSDGADGSQDKSRREGSDDDEEGSEDGLDGDDGRENVEDKRSTRQTSELLRRLHQVLALYRYEALQVWKVVIWSLSRSVSRTSVHTLSRKASWKRDNIKLVPCENHTNDGMIFRRYLKFFFFTR
jgi:hypothetical protein